MSRFSLEQMPMARELMKLANVTEPPADFGEVANDSAQTEPHRPPEVKRPILHAIGALAAPAAAFGVGTAAGALAGRGITHGLNLSPSAAPVLRKASPFLGGAMGLALQQYHTRAGKELSRAVEAYKSKSARPVSAE